MKDTSDSYVSNDHFYELYTGYLAEERVRKVHDAVLQAAMFHPALQRVVDLGCGQGNEFFHYGKPALYVGLDQNATPIHEARRIRLQADYRDVNFIKEIVDKYALTAAVSLFSTELTWPPTANHVYYEGLFGQTTLQAVFVAGGYAEHAEGEETKYRALVCDACRGYVKMLTTLSALPPLPLLVADAATLHLDLAAAERGYTATP